MRDRLNKMWRPSRPPRPCTFLLLVALAAILAGCPSYEDKYTGTYREVNPSARPGEQAIQVDFFRFGENASAVVRFYRPNNLDSDNPFTDQNETVCAWTSAEEFQLDDEWNFRLFLDDSSKLPRSRVFGRVQDGGEDMTVSMYEDKGDESAIYRGIEELKLERVEREANPRCDAIKDYFVEFSFPRDPQTGEFQSMPERASEDIENPVFVVSWLGVEPRSVGGRTLYASVSEHAPAFRLDTESSNNFDPDTHSLRNEFTVPISAPGLQMRSGDTALALGHFSVVDDSVPVEDIDLDEWVFSWNVDSEKMVASSLQPAFRPGCPDDTNRFGRALLFVKDSIWDVSSSVLEQLIDGEEKIERNSERHFFVVDVCAEDDQVLKLLINERFFTGQVALKVTDQFLGSDTVPLPRLNPYKIN